MGSEPADGCLRVWDRADFWMGGRSVFKAGVVQNRAPVVSSGESALQVVRGTPRIDGRAPRGYPGLFAR